MMGHVPQLRCHSPLPMLVHPSWATFATRCLHGDRGKATSLLSQGLWHRHKLMAPDPTAGSLCRHAEPQAGQTSRVSSRFGCVRRCAATRHAARLQ